MTRDREPLTPDERALADRLARSAPRAEPSPALDARILAAARAAARPAAGGGSGGLDGRGRRPRRRWPATLGIAASLALALGIAWQLRPVPESLPAVPRAAESAADAADAPAAARPASAPPDDAAQVRAPDPHREVRTLPAPPPLRAEAPPPAARSEPTPQPSAASAEAEAEARQARSRENELKATEARVAEQRGQAARMYEAAPQQTPVPLPSPPPAPPAPAAAAAEASGAESSRVAAPPPSVQRTLAPVAAPTDTDTDTGTAIGRERVPGAAATAETAPVLRTEEQDVFLDQPLDDAPPATADSPQVHRAWLARIRELRDQGEHEAARESLREFHRRHPGAELPEDLRGLLEE
ncbi:hypothetical protein H0E84_18790 [Luteimonas sp. SJ-92]|uniref:Uncharacterized protein n=1 Tax=Luteimonas salinisoli TaxID=2752307 RepID=A0A853JGD3_9GAMM|nr:hypothetical protein [Luteimonas salinisoli]NZA28426.1 hypothetical protein [Luteimonas salinisoli]